MKGLPPHPPLLCSSPPRTARGLRPLARGLGQQQGCPFQFSEVLNQNTDFSLIEV